MEQTRAFEIICAWMREHGAPLLVDNLAPGASTAHLDDVETRFGFAIPPELRELWSLHDGQLEEANGFVEMYDLFSAERAFAEQELISIPLEWLRDQSRGDAFEHGMTAEELDSPAWIPIAGRDSDGIAVCALTGRVFTVWHDDPPPRLCAASVTQWLSDYAARVEADDYRVEEGFGDYYLERRDRKREAADAEREQRARDEVRRRAEMPLFDLLDEATEKNDVDLGQAVIARAEQESPATLRAVIDRLFDRRRLWFRRTNAAVIAGILRTKLNQLDLSPAQWTTVAKGGETLGNNAICDVARSRMKRPT